MPDEISLPILIASIPPHDNNGEIVKLRDLSAFEYLISTA